MPRRSTSRACGANGRPNTKVGAHQLVNPAGLRGPDGCPPLGRVIPQEAGEGFRVLLSTSSCSWSSGRRVVFAHPSSSFSPAVNLSDEATPAAISRKKHAQPERRDLDGYELVGGGPEGLLSKPDSQKRCQVSHVAGHARAWPGGRCFGAEEAYDRHAGRCGPTGAVDPRSQGRAAPMGAALLPWSDPHRGRRPMARRVEAKDEARAVPLGSVNMRHLAPFTEPSTCDTWHLFLFTFVSAPPTPRPPHPR